MRASLCTACFINLKIVPLAVYESVIVADSFKPEYTEWLLRNADQSYMSRLSRRRSFCLPGPVHRLCFNCLQNARLAARFEDEIEAGDECLLHSTLRASGVQRDYLNRLIRCIEHHQQNPFLYCPLEKGR